MSSYFFITAIEFGQSEWPGSYGSSIIIILSCRTIRGEREEVSLQLMWINIKSQCGPSDSEWVKYREEGNLQKRNQIRFTWWSVCGWLLWWPKVLRRREEVPGAEKEEEEQIECHINRETCDLRAKRWLPPKFILRCMWLTSPPRCWTVGLW